MYSSGVEKLMNQDIYAVIQNGVIVNTQVLTNIDFQDPQFTWIIITNLIPQPSIGWTYDGKNFTPPPPPNIPPPTVLKAQVNVSEPDVEPILTDILNFALNGDDSYIQKYVSASGN